MSAPHLPRVDMAEVVVVGSGMAGLITALRLAPWPVVLLTKTPSLEGGSSALAQGGVAAAVGPTDCADDHAADTVSAGAGLVDATMARLLAHEGVARIREFLDDGLPFDRAPDGAPLLGLEAAHGRRRILHAGGDATGRVLVRALIERIRRTPSIRVVEDSFAVDLMVQDGRVGGVLAHHGVSPRGERDWVFYQCPRVVLATGGIGAAFRRTTNPADATGDGLAMAARAGARLVDLEFVQFHPTALATPAGNGPMPLLTEALRGAGAHLLDAAGRRFMADEHPQAELAPRDVVARAVWRRGAEGKPVFLDTRAVMANGGAERFPTVLSLCREAGIDPYRHPVPVAPAAHYHMGGVATDAHGRTSIAGLWACGEVAATGVHGANRLASNSLLEALVFADRVARDLRRRALPGLPAAAPPPIPAVPGAGCREILETARDTLRTTLYDQVGLRRDDDGLRRALARLGTLERHMATAVTTTMATADPAGGAAVRPWGELRNLLLIGRLVAFAALNRCETRGAHWRDDYPLSTAAWHRRQFLTVDALWPARSATPGPSLQPPFLHPDVGYRPHDDRTVASAAAL